MGWTKLAYCHNPKASLWHRIFTPLMRYNFDLKLFACPKCGWHR